MNKKILFLGAIISSCVIAFISGQSMADYSSNMPSSGYRSYNDSSSSSNAPYSSYGSQYSQYNYGYNGQDMGGNGSQGKQLQTESTVKLQGTVSSLNKVQYPDGTQVEMILDTDQGTKRIMLGPSRFIDQAKVKVQSGDKVTVTGYRVGANGNEIIVAQEINKNGYVLQLRTEQRQPMWPQPSYMYSGSPDMNAPMGPMNPQMGPMGGPMSGPYTSNPNPYSPVNRGY